MREEGDFRRALRTDEGKKEKQGKRRNYASEKRLLTEIQGRQLMARKKGKREESMQE